MDQYSSAACSSTVSQRCPFSSVSCTTMLLGDSMISFGMKLMARTLFLFLLFEIPLIFLQKFRKTRSRRWRADSFSLCPILPRDACLENVEGNAGLSGDISPMPKCLSIYLKAKFLITGFNIRTDHITQKWMDRGFNKP